MSTNAITLPNRCGISNCRTRRYHRDASDGHIYCKNGHQQPHTLEIEIDEADQFTQSSQRKVTRRASQTSSRGGGIEEEAGDDGGKSSRAGGREADEVGVGCFQAVLMGQLGWLMRRGGPRELEGVVRGLWSARLCVHSRWVAERAGEAGKGKREMFSSQEEDGGSDGEGKGSEDGAPRMLDTVCLLYFACVVLRMAVTVRDVLGWMGEDGFVYMDVTRAVPKKVLKRLPMGWRNRLRVPSIHPSPGLLHRHTLYLAHNLQTPRHLSTPQITLPALNHVHHVHRLLSHLSLPLPIFTTLETLTHLLHIPHAFPPTLTQKPELSAHPELLLHALLIVAVKLLYPFDDRHRVPYSHDDPTALSMNWCRWNATHASLPRTASAPHHPPPQPSTQHHHWSTQPTSIPHLAPTELDAYLNWFQRTFLPHATDTQASVNDFDRDVFRLFPLTAAPQSGDSVDGSAKEGNQSGMRKRVAETHESMSVLEPMDERDVGVARRVADRDPGGSRGWRTLRPGAEYRRWKRVEDVEETARVFAERVAWLAGVDVVTLVRCVRVVEGRLVGWCEERRRDERAEESRKGHGDWEFG